MAYDSNAETLKDGYIRANYDAVYATIEGDGWPNDPAVEFEEYYGELPVKFGYVNGYEVGQAYGGPEEGGWWVTTLEPVASIPVSSYEEACEAVDKLDTLLRERYEDERPYYSAAGGADATICFERRFAHSQPEEFPRYE